MKLQKFFDSLPDLTLREFRDVYMLAAYKSGGKSQRETAKDLGINRKTLEEALRRIRKHETI